jgi:hypothetical protein
VAESSVALLPVCKGVIMPTTTDEYERFAKECMDWARTAHTDAERKAFLDMARAWTLAAAKANGVIGVLPSDPLDETDSAQSH